MVNKDEIKELKITCPYCNHFFKFLQYYVYDSKFNKPEWIVPKCPKCNMLLKINTKK